MIKVCAGCKLDLEIDQFPLRTVNGKKYPRVYCKKCNGAKLKALKPSTREKRLERDKKRSALLTLSRKVDGPERAKIIFSDLRASDRKRKLEFSLTIEDISSLINKGCSYCGDNKFISLDRKDNSIGHTLDNVVPCCRRCNYIRRDMPYEAWLFISPKLKEAIDLGLLGTWTAFKP